MRETTRAPKNVCSLTLPLLWQGTPDRAKNEPCCGREMPHSCAVNVEVEFNVSDVRGSRVSFTTLFTLNTLCRDLHKVQTDTRALGVAGVRVRTSACERNCAGDEGDSPSALVYSDPRIASHQTRRTIKFIFSAMIHMSKERVA